MTTRQDDEATLEWQGKAGSVKETSTFIPSMSGSDTVCFTMYGKG